MVTVMSDIKRAQAVWEKEYDTKQLMTGTKPIKSFTQWVKQIIKSYDRRDELYPLQGWKVLDLGSGEGKNALYLAELGAQVYGIELARNAVETTKQRAAAADFEVGSVRVVQGSIGALYDFPDQHFDLIIDVTSSNSLSEKERQVYLEESFRTLKSDGHMFVRALCKDGDKNAKQLLQLHPGVERDTYSIPNWQQKERVFTELDIRDLYSTYFAIDRLIKEVHYTTYAGRKYKRNFWVLQLQKPT